MKKNQHYIVHIFLMMVFLFSLTGCCTVIKSAICSFKSTKYFVPLASDNRVIYEPGAEAFAEQMAKLLPQAIERVEAEHYRPFAKPVTIHICASQESYTKLTGLKLPASLTLKGVFFSPRLIKEQRPFALYLAHELSHLHLSQQIGAYKYAKLPVWFKEGLAASISGGGGAEKVTTSEAKKAIIVGKHFVPWKKGSIFSRKYGSYWGMENQMFYHQCMMFVDYLKATDEDKYRSFLVSIQDEESFAKSFNKSFGTSLTEMWEQFIKKLKSEA